MKPGTTVEPTPVGVWNLQRRLITGVSTDGGHRYRYQVVVYRREVRRKALPIWRRHGDVGPAHDLVRPALAWGEETGLPRCEWAKAGGPAYNLGDYLTDAERAAVAIGDRTLAVTATTVPGPPTPKSLRQAAYDVSLVRVRWHRHPNGIFLGEEGETCEVVAPIRYLLRVPRTEHLLRWSPLRVIPVRNPTRGTPGAPDSSEPTAPAV